MTNSWKGRECSMNSSTAEAKPSQDSEFAKNLQIIREIPFFSGLPLEAHKLLAYLASRERFKAGDHLFRQGDDDGQAFFIISGTAGLSQEVDGTPVDIREFKEGDFVSGFALLGPMRRLFSLEAKSEVECLILAREKFVKTMTQFPDQLPRLMESMVDRIRAWEEQFCANHLALCDRCKLRVGVSIL